jgi:bacterioferritin (cytochrome b1)
MGNLNLEVSSLKNRVAIREKEKVVLHEELDKEKDFKKGYKHIMGIWRKNRVKAKQKIKVFNKKLQDENEEFKGSITWLKL